MVNSEPWQAISSPNFSTASVFCFLLSYGQAQAGQSEEKQKAAGESPATTQATHTPAARPKNRRSRRRRRRSSFARWTRFCAFASKDTLFPIKREVKRQLVSRDEVEAYVTKHTSEDEDAKRLRRSELVLKKFGLLPRDFDLGTFLVALLKEQVAGYYDPKTRTVNLLDWLGAEQQKPVLAHELTHALQDQSFNLEKYMKPADADLAKKKEITAQDIENDEVSTTRQAVVEGQAMVVLVDYMLEPMGLSLKDSPQVVQSLKDGMLVGTAGLGGIPQCADLHERGADLSLSLRHRFHR